MYRSMPSISILKDGIVIGALDIRHTDFHTVIRADRAMCFGEAFAEGTAYQINIKTGEAFNKEFCAQCSNEHYVVKKSGAAITTLDVRLLRGSTPYALNEDIFIYNDLQFICT